MWGSKIGIVSCVNDECASFEYDKDFLNSGIEISPIYMPLSRSVYRFPNLNKQTFKGLPGLLADSLPDRYGDRIMQAWLASKGRTIDSFSPIERLCYMGKRGMGALEYIPSIGLESSINEEIDIDSMVDLASKVLSERKGLILDEKDANSCSLIKFGTSAGGARAKAIVAIENKTGKICSGQIADRNNYTYWIIKFDDVVGNGDHNQTDSSGYTRVEYAYYLMAKAANININECKLLELNDRCHFMTRRFDRQIDSGQKIHMQTLGVIGHFDYNIPRSCSYEKASKICMMLKLDSVDIYELFRRMVFNVLAINHDDHVKNISFLMDRNGKWSLAPAYDLCYSYNPNSMWVNQHQMSINGKGKDITLSDLYEAAKNMNINHNKAKIIIDEVKYAVSKWNEFARTANVNIELEKTIKEALEVNLKSFL